MPFTDNFTDTDNTDLAAHTPSGGTAWTRAAGSANDIEIVSNALNVSVVSGTAVYTCDDQGAANQYTQAKQNAIGNNLYQNTFICVRLVDGNNFIGYRQTGFNANALTKNVSGTLTDLITSTVTNGNTYKVEASGTTIRLYENGSQVGSDQTVTDHQTETTQGVVSSDSRSSSPYDDFEAGILGVVVPVPSATLAMTGYAPTPVSTNHQTVNVPVASLNLTGYTPTPVNSGNVTIDVPLASLALAGFNPTALTPVGVDVPVAVLNITGYAPTPFTTIIVDVPNGVLTLAGLAPIPSKTENLIVKPSTATLTLMGYIPGLDGYEIWTVQSEDGTNWTLQAEDSTTWTEQ